MKRILLALALAAGCLSFAGPAPVQAAESPVPADSRTLPVSLSRPQIKLVSNVVYEQVPARGYENVPMKMDLLIPQTDKPMPAVLFITGGGFINANKDNYIQERMRLAEEGYVTATAEYRVAPAASFPAPLEDIKAAVRYLRAHADQFHIDPDRIGVLGGSAGGYLAAMAGTTSGTGLFDSGDNLDQSSDVQAVVNLYGVSDLTSIGADYSEEVQALHRTSGATEALWLKGSPVFNGRAGGVQDYPEEAEKANPIHYISDKTPPFLLMHGSADTVVSPSQTEILHQALLARGIDSARYVVPGAAHGGVYWVQPEVLDLVVSFFNAHLKNK